MTAQSRPEVFIAEPVGSCTDLVATVSYPLRRLYGDNFTVAPASVLVDPIRAMRVFGLAKGGTFSEKVLYIYNKQLEEADLIVISKCDLLDQAQLESLRRAIAAKYPRKEMLTVSSRTGAGLDTWFEKITSQEQVVHSAMEIDYQVYAEGEALLGWLNASVRLTSEQTFDSDQLLKKLAGEIQQNLQAAQAEVAHLKMTLSPDNSLNGEIAAINLVRNDFVPELSLRLEDPVRGGELMINLRAEASPEVLAQAVQESLSQATGSFESMRATLDHLEHFRPGKPQPTHRFTS